MSLPTVTHACHAHDCIRVVPPRFFMCAWHWRALPLRVQRAIWAEYRPGQENDKQPSIRYLAVQQFAVGLIAGDAGDYYFARAQVYRERAIAEEQGDPLHGLVGLVSEWEERCR